MLRLWGGIFDIDRKLAEIADEESQTLDPGFWDDPKKAEAHMRKIREKKVWTEAFSVIENSLGDVDVLVEFQKWEKPPPKKFMNNMRNL